MEIHTGDLDYPEKPPKTEVLFISAPEKTYHNPVTLDDTDLSSHETVKITKMSVVELKKQVMLLVRYDSPFSRTHRSRTKLKVPLIVVSFSLSFCTERNRGA